MPVPEKTELTYPRLGSMLDQLVAEFETGDASARTADADDPSHLESSVAVTIYLLPGNVDAVVSFLEDNGASPRNVGEDYIEAYVPTSLLGQTSEQPGVLRVREITPPHPAQSALAVAGHGPPAHGSAAWNEAGYRGDGIKVGINRLWLRGDIQSNGDRVAMRRWWPGATRILVYLPKYWQIVRTMIYHGTLVAESIIDIAPEVSLYIANPRSFGDLRNTVEWMISEGVLVINHSRSWTFDGPGDGTSPYTNSPLKTVDRAVEPLESFGQTAAGNHADNPRGSEPTPTRRMMGLSISMGLMKPSICNLAKAIEIRVQLRWDDSWDAANRDFDL